MSGKGQPPATVRAGAASGSTDGALPVGDRHASMQRAHTGSCAMGRARSAACSRAAAHVPSQRTPAHGGGGGGGDAGGDTLPPLLLSLRMPPPEPPEPPSTTEPPSMTVPPPPPPPEPPPLLLPTAGPRMTNCG